MSDGQNMKDTTIKCTNEQKDAINAIVTDLGNNATQKDAMDHLLRLNRLKKEEEAGRTIPRLDDLRYMFSRFEGIYSEMYLSGQDQQQKLHEEIATLTEEVAELKTRYFDTLQEFEKVQNEAAEQVDEMSQSIRKITEEKEAEVTKARGEAALARETAEKELQQMRLLVKESNDSKEQSARLVALAQEMAEAARQKAVANEEQAQKAIEMQEEMKNLRMELARMKEEAIKREQEHLREVDRLKETAEVEKERAILEAERRLMIQHSELREQVASLREKVAELTIELERKGEGRKE